MSSRWSFIQRAVERGRPAVRGQLAGVAPRRVERRPVDALGRGLERDPEGHRPARSGAGAVGAARERPPQLGAVRDRALRRGRHERRVLRQHAASGSAARAATSGRGRSARTASSTSRLSSWASASTTIESPSSTSAIGPPSAASGATWPIISPWVPPEKRPSVSSATRLAEALADERARDAQHLLHAGPADRALVADDDDVARDDLAVLDRLEAGLLAVEHAGRAAVVAALVAGELDDGALGRERAVEDRQAAGRLDRRLDRVDDLLALGVSTVSAAICAIVRPSTVVCSPWSRSRLEQLAHDQADAAGVVHVGGRVAAARAACPR